jgi:hypothetical protein
MEAHTRQGRLRRDGLLDGLGVVTSVLSGEQNHSCYGQNSEQGYIDEYAAASFRGPHEQGEPKSATSNCGPA